jgi:hypothetical protein
MSRAADEEEGVMGRTATTNGLENGVMRWVSDLGGRFAPDRIGDALSHAALEVAKTTAAITRNVASVVAARNGTGEAASTERIHELQRTVAALVRRVDDLIVRLDEQASVARKPRKTAAKPIAKRGKRGVRTKRKRR